MGLYKDILKLQIRKHLKIQIGKNNGFLVLSKDNWGFKDFDLIFLRFFHIASIKKQKSILES